MLSSNNLRSISAAMFLCFILRILSMYSSDNIEISVFFLPACANILYTPSCSIACSSIVIILALISFEVIPTRPPHLQSPALMLLKNSISCFVDESNRLRHNVSAWLSAVASLMYSFFSSSSNSRAKFTPSAITASRSVSESPKNAE